MRSRHVGIVRPEPVFGAANLKHGV